MNFVASQIDVTGSTAGHGRCLKSESELMEGLCHPELFLIGIGYS